ncbi:TonB-dependent receptor domain-containing protein [Novosphingobium mangrovi (ex Huang et al. 2023)]|uniref:TonB-dependent receptor n=1 Tax=Novosphingobium mangrovi (ex Huang et al. 2023) TaxID=2976432 RepID=A0ABT2I4E9_9SPHN|nr:TonB-dependent receptor [Novosphingobium mangrovi (ex Huang et al. 2023)]MCT2399674.1 TonB-dependent receptor [Novosphingobium mangrovi (ex Huang et al. 2023)]
MKNQTLTALKAGAAPLVLGFALFSSAAYAQDAASDEGAGDAIIVTGTRIVAPNQTSIAPITTMTSDDISLSGTTRTEDLLNSLPQVVASQSSSLANGATGTATVNLRGLGSSRTLVLINGRRLMTGDPNTTTSAADLNFIPAALVKRVDVLTGGASATYGADAVAGVVNFVMDTDFEGFKIDANYGFYNHDNRNNFITPLLDARQASGFSGFDYPTGNVTDGGQYDITAAFGTSFDDGRGHATAYVGYRKANPVLQSKRDYSSCTISASASGAFSCGGSLTNQIGTGIYYDSTPIAGGGVGTTSTIGGLGAGTFTRGLVQRYNYAPLNYFQRPDERYTAGVFADYEINEAIHPYMEFMFMDDRTLAQIAPSGDFGNTLTINCDNPLMSDAQRSAICTDRNMVVGYLGTFPLVQKLYDGLDPAVQATVTDPANPNTAFFQLLRRNVEGGPRVSDLQHTSFRTVIGSRGELGKAWSYDAYYQYGRTNYTQVYSNEFSVARLRNALDVVTDGSGNPICRAALNGTDPNCVPYDIFSGNPITADQIGYLGATGIIKGQTSQQVFSATFTGLLGEYGIQSPLASDGINIAIGAEYRRDALELTADNAFNTGDLTGQGAPTKDTAGNYKVTEFFGEIDIPLIQDGLVYNLSFNGGYRYSHYKISNGRTFNTDTFKLGVDFAPVSDIRIRAGYNRAVRVPNIQELFAPQIVALDGVSDPCSGFTITAADVGCLAQGIPLGSKVTANPAEQYNGLIGGNPDLNPEKATTKTLGVVIQPRWIPRLTISVDWFDIKVKNAIQGYGADAILNSCVDDENLQACALVTRNAAGSLWLSSDGYVIDTPVNVGGVKTRGFEFTGNWSTEIASAGTLSLNLVGTLLDRYVVDDGLSTPYDCSGVYGPTCGGSSTATPLPTWRHKARATFRTAGGFGASVQWRHISAVDYEAGVTNSLDSKIAAQDYFDLTMTYDIGDHLQWRLGATNLFDKQPPLVSSSACASVLCNGNTYPGTYDPLGRYIFTGVTMNF